MTGPVIDWDAVRQETLRHLSSLIRIDTSNPPGNERPAAEYLRQQLDSAGVETTVLEMAPQRSNLVARIRGDNSEGPLLLLTHLDVVPAAGSWSHEPFGGKIVDGFVWGRGAVDMKHIVAASLTAILLAVRLRLPLKRDVIFAATADEESAGESGAGWLFRKHRELVACEVAISEGGDALRYGGEVYLLIEAAEKGWLTVDLTRRSRPGHSSIPTKENCLLELGRILARLGERRFPHRVTPSARAFIEGLAERQPEHERQKLRDLLDPARFDDAIASLEVEDNIKRRFEGMLHSHATPTVLMGGESTWAIPGTAQLTLAGRALPGDTLESWLAQLEEIVGPLGEHSSSAFDPGVEMDHKELFETLRRTVQRHNPEAHVLPTLMPGGGDVRHAAFAGAAAYGFFPLPPDGSPSIWELAHGQDERISLRNTDLCTRYAWDVICLENDADEWLSPPLGCIDRPPNPSE
jgi:acetylornithine deacetylase/succinyl-diaminopimelate desuccinylase-like protein